MPAGAGPLRPLRWRTLVVEPLALIAWPEVAPVAVMLPVVSATVTVSPEARFAMSARRM